MLTQLTAALKRAIRTSRNHADVQSSFCMPKYYIRLYFTEEAAINNKIYNKTITESKFKFE